MKLTVQYAGLTDPGRVRQSNEDNWIAYPDQGLFIVADGMGGQFAGMLASKAVVETLPGLIRQHFEKLEGLPKGRAERRMAKAVATLSSQIRQQTQNEPGLEGMGSTVVCALVRGSQVLIGHHFKDSSLPLPQLDDHIFCRQQILELLLVARRKFRHRFADIVWIKCGHTRIKYGDESSAVRARCNRDADIYRN